jgi:4-hydroxybenzoyl-CoA reductase subunit beta
MMRLPPFRYFAPRGVAEAIGLLAEHGGAATVVAGGTDLYPNMKRLQMEPRVLVGLRRIRELAEFRGDARSGLTIGAGATLTQVSEHAEVAGHYPALARAAGVVSTPQLRNMGTLGGNVCVDTRCNYYNQSYEWRRAIGFCMKKDGDICLVAPGSARCWRSPLRYRAGPLRCAQVTLAVRRGGSPSRPSSGRRHRVPSARRLADPTELRLPPVDGWRKTTVPARGASTSRCSASRRPCG